VRRDAEMHASESHAIAGPRLAYDDFAQRRAFRTG
jgi:hypothetical protein